MAYTFSTDQLSIIESRDQNILVSAAAGSGKTSVLTERIVRLVADEDHPVDIDRILVVTFTNAAAKEMKERIGASLNEMLVKHPENVHLRKQSQLIYNAQITTIDSYCLYILKNHFHRIGVDPVFRVASEGEMKLLKADIVSEVIKRAYAGKDPDFYHVIDCYSRKDDDETLEESILNLYTFAMSHPKPKDWLNKCRDMYKCDTPDNFKNSFYAVKMLDAINEVVKTIRKDFYAAKEITEDPMGVPGYKKITDSDAVFLIPFLEAADNRDYDRMVKEAAASNFITFTGSKKNVDPDTLEELKDYRNAYKSAFLKLKEDYLFQNFEESYHDMVKTGMVVGKLIDLVLDFIDSFAAAKRERAVIDFNDMEHMAIEILIENYDDEDGSFEITDVARNLRDYYAEVMVDEYQDSNMVQEILIKSVSRETSDSGRNRFMVGDVKQSIYRFRLARPDIFLDKSKRYCKDADSPDRLITLKQNYRSRDGVIDSVNAIFKDIMTPERGGIEYDDDAKLTRAGSFPDDTQDNITEVMLLDAGKLKKDDFNPYETDAIALKISSLVGKMQVIDKESKELRPASYKDFAVLFRTPSSWRKYIKASFDKLGIPYHMEGVGDFYDTREIRDIMAFLKVLDNPLDDISLYASLTSCFGNLTDEECVRIKAEDGGRHYYLWDKVKAYIAKNEDNKLNDFMKLVARYRKYVTYMPISELITTLMDETGYRYIVSALPDGKQRLANVNLLILKASEYAKTSFHGLFHFMRYVELIKKTEQEEGEANILDENSDVVKIMSIHKSKGLEFPICIVAGIESEFSKKDYTKPFVFDIDYGIGAKYIDPVRRTKRETLANKIIVNRLKKENLGEEIRVLYVALTRAKEKLIIVGGTRKAEEWLAGNPEDKESSYLGLIGNTVINKNGSLFNLQVSDLAAIESAETVEEIDRQLVRKELELGAQNSCKEEYKQLVERLEFKYPYENLAGLYTKTSVSELKLAHMEIDEEASQPFKENEPKEYVPSFAGGEDSVKGTQRGTAYHSILQHLDYASIANADSIEEEYEKQKQDIILSGKMSEEELSVINSGKVINFLKNDLALRMGRADENGSLFKEQPFVMGISASEMNPDFPSDETVLIQGVIDAYFIEDGEIVLLDYKSDAVGSAEELVARYKTQLDYYAAALAKITGLKVKEKLIYSLRLNQSIFL